MAVQARCVLLETGCQVPALHLVSWPLLVL